MDPNFNSQFSQKSNANNLENAQNLPFPLYPPNIQNFQNLPYPHYLPNLEYSQNSQNAFNFPYPFFHPQMQNFSQPFLPQIIQNNPPKDVASRTDLSSPTEMGSLSNSHIQFSSQARDEQVTSSKQRIEKNKEKHSWSITEEKLLASSWLTISTDSVIGNGQNDRAFWKRVAEYFNEAKHDGPTRLHSTVKNH